MRHRCCWMLPGLLSAVLVGCGKPTLDLHDVSVREMTLQSVTLDVHVTASNPYLLAIPIERMDYDVRAKGRLLSRGNWHEPGHVVPALSSTTATLPLVLHYRDLIALAGRSDPDRDTLPCRWRVEAIFNLLGSDLPVTMTGTHQLPMLRQPTWQLEAVSLVREPSAGLELVFALENPNRMALSLANLSGTLQLGQRRIVTINRELATALPPGEPVQVKMEVALPTPAMMAQLAVYLGRGEMPTFKGDFHLVKPIRLEHD